MTEQDYFQQFFDDDYTEVNFAVFEYDLYGGGHVHYSRYLGEAIMTAEGLALTITDEKIRWYNVIEVVNDRSTYDEKWRLGSIFPIDIIDGIPIYSTLPNQIARQNNLHFIGLNSGYRIEHSIEIPKGRPIT